jgi:hypothetical protein
MRTFGNLLLVAQASNPQCQIRLELLGLKAIAQSAAETTASYTSTLFSSLRVSVSTFTSTGRSIVAGQATLSPPQGFAARPYEICQEGVCGGRWR